MSLRTEQTHQRTCCKKHATVETLIRLYKHTLHEQEKASPITQEDFVEPTQKTIQTKKEASATLRIVNSLSVLPSFSELYAKFRDTLLRSLKKISKTSKKKPKKTKEVGTKIKKKPTLPKPLRWFTKTVVYDYFVSFFILGRSFPIQAVTGLLIAGILFTSINYLYTDIFQDLPDPKDLVEQPLPVSSKILDRNGNILYRMYEDENRTIVPLEEIPITLIQATIAIEDQDFYNHYGFSIRGIIRAFVSNQQSKSVQGGSTLTQQLVKNRLLSPERTFQRKIKELILAVLVENTYSKNEILEMYLNQAPYGGSTYGVEEAAQTFFGKKAKFLTLSESALLAGLPASPTVYSPYGSHPELAKARQVEVLRRMAEEGFITWDQAELASAEEIVLTPRGIEIEAPHFVMYIRSLLADRYGEELVNNGGLIVTTTLDLPTQKTAQDIVTTEVDSIRRLRVSNGAALVTNPQTGEILAMVGSTNYFDFEHDGQVNVTVRPRQPGSSIKPLTYALALEKGNTPSTYIDDAPITYTAAGSPPYSPKNYDGKYHGKVTLREALASSYNIPAVKLLAEVGVATLLERAPEFGITTWDDPSRFGLSLTLGGGEVLLTEMAELYGTLSNQGKHTSLNPIIEVKTYDGTILYENLCIKNGTCQSQQVISPAIAYQITDILKDNQARTPAFGPQSTLTIPNQEVAVKTGTTNNLRDNWTIGYTTNRLVAVWVGNNDNTSMSYVASGITGASPIWNKIIRTQLSDENPHTFTVPESIMFAEVCTRTSIGARRYREAFIVGTPVTPKCQENGQLIPAVNGTTVPNLIFSTQQEGTTIEKSRGARLPTQSTQLLRE
ncbi:MAG: penicillin-binding protein [Pseudomonadales bacterium]|nr:penicillin-binding protein [Pseudomonadales bacterium]